MEGICILPSSDGVSVLATVFFFFCFWAVIGGQLERCAHALVCLCMTHLLCAEGEGGYIDYSGFGQ